MLGVLPAKLSAPLNRPLASALNVPVRGIFSTGAAIEVLSVNWLVSASWLPLVLERLETPSAEIGAMTLSNPAALFSSRSLA